MKTKTDRVIISAAIFLLIVVKTSAEIIRVPQDFPTIQSAIQAAVAGDTVLVSPGFYHENVDFSGKDIVLSSLFLTSGNQQYINNTVIDPDSGSVVTFARRETANAHLCGFTITGGTGTIIDPTKNALVGGGGILIRGASPVIRNNLIVRNSTWPACFGFGGGIAIMESAGPRIVRNTITENDINGQCAHLLYHGGGIWIDSTSNPVIGGSLENANDIYSNRATACEQLFFQRSDHVINAQYNYWGGCPPSALAVCSAGNVDFSNCLSAPAVKVDEAQPNLPAHFQLLQNYPNPFNALTRIEFELSRANAVSLKVFNLHGEEVAVFFSGKNLSAGRHKINWNGEDLPSGIYIYRLQTGGGEVVAFRKLVLLK